MENCRSCGRDTGAGKEKKQRRRLSSSSIKQEVQTLHKFVVERLEISTEDFLQGFICRSCISMIKRYLTLHSQVSSTVEKGLQMLPATEHNEQPGEGISSVTAPSAAAHPSRTSPALRATIFYKSRPKSYLVTPARRRLFKPLVRKNYRSFALQCVKNKSAMKVIVKAIGQVLHKEVIALCSDKSTFNEKSKKALLEFKFSDVMKYLEAQAPTLLSLLRSSTRTRKQRSNSDQILVLLTGIMCKHRRPSICQLQRLISLILYAGHSSKLVYQRLQKLGLCLSHSKSIQLIDRLGDDFDVEVKEWKRAVEESCTAQDTETTVRHVTAPWIDTGSPPDMELSTSAMSPLTPDMELSTSMSPLASCIGRESPIPTAALSMSGTTKPSFTLYSSEEGTTSNTSSPSSLESSENLNVSTFSIDCSGDSESMQSGVDENPTVGELNMSTSPTLAEGTADSSVRQSKTLITGYKIVFDNIDKNVKPRFMRTDSQVRSLHFVQSYAVKDRIDYSCLSAMVPTETNLYTILPGEEDYKSLKSNFSVHVARLLVKYLPFFTCDFKGLLPAHIPHKYSKEMSMKSEVVPLGVLPKNETLYQDMIEILEHFKTYIPSFPIETSIPGIEQTQDKCYVTTLVGGDYLSVARARGAQLIRSNSDLREHRLDGFLPVVEDWHAKVCFMEAMWNRLYHTNSAMDRGTIYQLRNLLNRRNVTNQPKKDVNASEDFLEVVIIGYILAAAMSYLGMECLDDVPLESIVSPDLWMEDDSVRCSVLKDISSHIVEEHVNLSTNFCDESVKTGGSGSVYDYSCEVLSLGLIFLDFKDAVREGDGDRVILMWKYFMLIFKATGHTNYALEAHTILTQYFVMLPPSLAEQLKWSRFVNVHGLPGHNISCDLHLEHTNRNVQTAIDGLGANKTEKAIIRTGKSTGAFSKILDTFDLEVGVSVSGRHSHKSMLKDLQKVVEQLTACNIFDTSNAHKSFPKIKTNLIRKIKEEELKAWIIDKFAKTHYCNST